MGAAKSIRVEPISATDARRLVRLYHYSHKCTSNSQLHLGVFLDGKCGGAMQFGPSLDKRKIVGIVADTPWNGFLELNRMAFADWLPRNSESRALAVAFRFIRKTYPWVQWVVSFADATQCGDGAIYRASGFVLTGLKKNTQIWEAPSGEVFNDTSVRPGIGGERERERAAQVFSRTSLTDGRSKQQQQQAQDLVFSRASLTGQSQKQKQKQKQALSIVVRTADSKLKGPPGSSSLTTGASSMRMFKEAGWRPKPGFQLRYVYFLDPTARERLTVPVVPFETIAERGAGMYKGIPRAGSAGSGTPPHQGGGGGATPTPALHSSAPGDDDHADDVP